VSIGCNPRWNGYNLFQIIFFVLEIGKEISLPLCLQLCFVCVGRDVPYPLNQEMGLKRAN